MKKNSILIYLLFLFSCDLVPRIQKDILLAQEYINEQKFKEAVQLYEDILKKGPNNTLRIKIHYQLSEIYSIQLKEFDKALNHYDELLAITKDLVWTVKIKEKQGELLYSFVKDYPKAQKIYLQLSSFKPRLENHDFFLFRQGLCFYHLNNFKKANELFLEIQEENPQSLYYLGLIQFHQSNWNEAIAWWQKYVGVTKDEHDLVQAKFLMANAYENNEDLKSAYNLYYSILGEYPNTVILKKRIDAIYNRKIARRR